MFKISIIEDQTDIRNSLVRNINKEIDMCCHSHFASAEEALETVPDNPPDLILMDIGLPKMNGVECMIRLSMREIKSDFLMFTVFDDDEHVFDALRAGAIGYVLKNEGSRGAIRAIREYMAGGSPMSRNIARKVLNSFNRQTVNKDAVFNSLTKQQMTVLEQLAQGLLNKEIADRLKISERTVKQHNNAIYKKLQVFNRTEAVKKYLEQH